MHHVQIARAPIGRVRIATVAVAALLALGACDARSGGLGGMTQGQTLGTGAGAAAGGLAGYAISGGPVGVLLGAAAGGLVGNRLANFLESDAQEAAAQAAARAAEVPTGERVTWEKTDVAFQTEAHGWATPTGEAFQSSSGATCRRIHQSATHEGATEEDVVTLCRGSSGWTPA